MRNKLLYCCTIFCLQLHAQILPFKTYTEKDGLITQNQINAIIRDQKGILWIGTAFGINWFDGQRFTEPVLKLRSGQLYVTNFFKDQLENLWVLTFYNGIYKYGDGRFTNYLVDSSIENNMNNVFDMIQYDDSTYIVATDHNVHWFNGNTFRLFDASNPELRIQFYGISLLNKEKILFLSSKGVFFYKKQAGNWEFAGKILEDYLVNSIEADNGAFWVATRQGLIYFPDAYSLLAGRSSRTFFKGESISGLAKSPVTDTHWITASRLHRLSGDSIVTYTEANGLPAVPGLVYCDDENITWLGSSAGLSKLVAETYQFHDLRQSPLHSMVTCLAKDNSGKLWIGTYDGLGEKINNKYIRHNFVNNRRTGYIAWLHPSKDILYAGTSAGILKISGTNLSLVNKLVTTDIFVEDDGRLLLATEQGNVYRFSNDSLTKIVFSDTLGDFIDGIHKDALGNLWLGFRSAGIRKFIPQGNRFRLAKEYSARNGYPNLRIRSAGADKDGNLLFGTRTNGLLVISARDHDVTWQLNTSNGLSGNWVKSITRDEQGNVYLATSKGVNILGGTYDNPSFRSIRVQNENITDETSYVLPDQSRVWVGTENGILEYFPNRDFTESGSTRIFITQFSVNGKPDTSIGPYISRHPGRRLSHNSNVIAFEFAGISMKTDDPIQYRYKLNGQDVDWTFAGERNFVSYNLPPGRYTFMVQAKNRRGEWSSQPASFPFEIAAPFWKKWWFTVGILLAVVGISYLFYRYRLRQAMKLEALRSRISTDLHDDIGSTLSSISILSEMALHGSSANDSALMMQEIKQNSMSLMEKMDDIVWSINPKNDSLEKLLVRIKSFAARLFEAKNVEYSIDIDDSVKHARLSMETRQHIYMMLKEAINNIVKYSGCTKASISVNFSGGWLRIIVSDNGIGFDELNVQTGNGLLNMRSRAQLMKADIRIKSAPGKGTLISWQSKIK